MSKITREEFIERANKAHNGKYNYSEAEYVNITTNIYILCPIHGGFWQNPSEHARGRGCPLCAKEVMSIKKRKDKIYNVATYDIYVDDKNIQKIWHRMLDRCYSPYYQKRNPSYIGCRVCDEWLLFSNFYKWVLSPLSGYKKGYHLDKDILVKGNKVYGPETCCFVPSEINEMFTHTNKKLRKGYVIVKNNKFYVRVYQGGKYLRGKVFEDENDALKFYKDTKEYNIKNIATKYFQEHKINEIVYNALMNYQVEISNNDI